MQQLGDLVDQEGDRGLRLRPRGRIDALALQHGLGEFEIPVAEHVPDEAVGGRRRVVEAVDGDGVGHLRHRLGGLGERPGVERLGHGLGPVVGLEFAAVHLGEAGRVPELGREVAVALDPLGPELDVAAGGGERGEGEAQGIGAEAVDEIDRIDHVALRLRHLRTLLVADEGVQVDRLERGLIGEVQAHHHHPGDPEEDDVLARHQGVGGVEAGELRRLVRPAERRERPERGGEPRVEDVGVAPNRNS
ncbi:hypothetical protein CHKEEEPN_3051 [Methylorubrum podarium]|nr:hypothetical protein CHKEEEPN_3051 [Methylorubrum podarium]